MKANISKDILDREQNVAGFVWQGKNNSQKRCMKLNDAARPIYPKTNAFGISLEAGLLQVIDSMNCGYDEIPDYAILHPISFDWRSVCSMEWCYSNIKCEALKILYVWCWYFYWLEKFQHYCFVRNVCIITDQKPLVAILSKDMATLSQWWQYIMLWIHQNRVHIIYKSGLDLYIMDWLSCNSHTENEDQEIAGMGINMNTINTSVNLPVCTSIEDLQVVIHEDAHLQELRAYIVQGWSHKKEEVYHSMRQYWPKRNDLAMTDGIVMKGKRLIIPFQLQKKILQHLHSSHMGIEKMWLNMNVDIGNIVKQCTICLNYQQTQLHKRQYCMDCHGSCGRWFMLIFFYK